MTSYAARHQAASDDVWAAWYRIGVSPLDGGVSDGGPWSMYLEAIEPMVRIVTPILWRLLDELGADLQEDARFRIARDATSNVLNHLPWALNEAVADALARPEPVPFEPPPAGSWIRNRWLPRAGHGRYRGQLEPEWNGLWHRFSGDLSVGDRRTRSIRGRTVCGRSVTLREDEFFSDTPTEDTVVVNEQPGVDACRRCAGQGTDS